MRTDFLHYPAAVIRVAGLLVLGGVLAVARPAMAQEACPLPDGVTPPAGPQVTARQVEDGNASLMEFALAVTDQFNRGSASVEEALYVGCIVRQEGSSYRSGPTYVIQLTPDGRIFVHAKNMALSGRPLNPVIYAAILQALGINPADLANPASAVAAFTAAAAGNGGTFNVPFIPGASGYATVYFSANFRSPIVVLAGFDLDSSHVSEEEIDFGDPATTASDVVDRETLKAFVEEAGNYVIDFQQSGDPAALSRSRIALRDPNGPWRHGSVYLYILDTNSNIILFHGAFPDRFELRPLVATVRDTVTGEFILPQVIAAAKSGPEGGFVRYYFDDPTDETDSADIPKVGYAREFTGQVQTAFGPVPINFIIGSGFYLSAPEVVAARQNQVLQTVLPQIMRTMTASTLDAVSGRIQQANSGTPPAAGFRLGGASTLSDVLMMNGPALGNGSFDFNWLLSDSSFMLPLNQSSTGSGPMDTLTLWGSADYRSISDDNMAVTAYDGDVVSAHLGIDSQLGKDMLGGIALSLSRGVVDYTDSELATGEFTTTLSSINPYVGWKSAGGTVLWAAAGYGWGEVEFEESTNSQASDMTQQMVAAGINRSLATSEQLISGGTTSLVLKAETAFTRADVEGAGSLNSIKLDASRHRLLFEGTHARKLASEATLTPSVELGVRYDGGDGETGGGLEVGAGLGYTAGRLSLKVNARSLLTHDTADDYEEWGFSGMVMYQAVSDGRGLSVTVGSTWGAADGSVRSLWTGRRARGQVRSGAILDERMLHQAALLEGTREEEALREAMLLPAQRFQAELRYGLNGPNGLGLWLPYVGTDSGGGFRALRLGVQLRSDPGFEAGLELSRRESVYLPTHNAIELRGISRW